MTHTNFEQIRYAFFEADDRAREARDLLRRVRQGTARRNLTRLLRHHEEEEISDPETWLRDQFDFLIDFFSMVEVGRLSGVVHRPPSSHVRFARSVLAHPAVRYYYEDNYPLYLPQAHLLFVSRHGVALDRGVRENGPELFRRFYALSHPVVFDDSAETILWFLDGGARDGYDIDDVIEVLQDQKLFVEYLSDRPDDYKGGELGTVALAV